MLVVRAERTFLLETVLKVRMEVLVFVRAVGFPGSALFIFGRHSPGSAISLSARSHTLGVPTIMCGMILGQGSGSFVSLSVGIMS